MIKKTMIFSTRIPDKDTDTLISKIRVMVSQPRCIKSFRFKFSEDIMRSLAGELLLRYGLQFFGILNSGHIQFGVNEFGKPFITGIQNFDFNISHSGNWVIVGMSNCAIGVDVEKIRPIDFGIADQFFTLEECKMIKDAPDRNSMQEMFFRIWVLKESYIKAIGKGLSQPLNSFSVCLSESDVSFRHYDKNPVIMFSKEYEVDEQHKAAVSCEAKNLPSDLLNVNFYEMVDSF